MSKEKRPEKFRSEPKRESKDDEKKSGKDKGSNSSSGKEEKVKTGPGASGRTEPRVSDTKKKGKQKDDNVIKIKELNLDDLPPNQSNKNTASQGGLKILIIGKPGCFARGTKIRMYDDSIKNIEKIEIGDELMGPDLKPRVVESLCKGFELMYKIYIKDRTTLNSVTVNENHILSLWNGTFITDITVKEYLNLCTENPDINNLKWIKVFPDFIYNNSDSDGAILEFIPEYSRTFQILEFSKNNLEKLEPDFYFGITLGNSEDEPTVDVGTKGAAKDPSGDERFLLADGSVVHNTGKTTLIKELLYRKSDIFPYGIVQSGTEDSNKAFESVFPPLFVYNELDVDALGEFIKRQKLARTYLKNPWGVALLDDISLEPKIFKNKIFSDAIKNGRHYKAWFIIAIQYVVDFPASLRQGIDGIFIFREAMPRLRKILHENFGMCTDYSTFCKLLDELTEDYTALYVNNTSQSNKIEDCFFYYKADPGCIPADFRFGCEDYWEFDKDRYFDKEGSD